MWRWFELLSFDKSLEDIARMKREAESGAVNPRDFKLELARELATRFHDAAEAERAVAGWHAVVRGEGDTALLPLSEIAVGAEGLRLPALLTAAGLTSSNSEANRKIRERAVRVDSQVVEDAQRVFTPGFEGVLQVGKRNFARVRLSAVE
jgi:tyrosyl-tRNA synthetase